ncbi:MAG: PKD domain-containing protein, partial [Cyclobacteriaceae bacterium]
SQGKITSISFPEGDCDAVSLLSSTSASPVDLFYSSAGDYTVELTAIHPNGSIDRVLDTVTVLNQTAPDISFMTTNQCVSNGSTFTAQSSTEDITNYSWDFDGDGLEDSNEASPVYTFGSVGTYDVSLTVSNGNCTNTAKQKFTIYPEPPIPSTIFTSLNNCANSEITVLNQTDTTGYGAGISYVYSFTGQPDRMTNSHQVVYQFDTPGEKILEVRAIIPGCESAIFRDTIQIIDAPVLQFSASSVCIGEVTIFTNETAGQDFFWDFGDGFTSTQKSPEHLYLTDGAYQVTLQSSNELGCTSIETIEVLVSPLPTANFDYDLVCEADGVVLTDVSTVDGSDIVAWEWYLFDELVSEEERPELVFSNSGDQTVTLRVTANNGCSSTITQDLMVLSQQEAAFDVQVACLGSASTLIDLHPNEEIISRNWFIDGQALASEQARLAYTFTEPGDYEIELSIVNQNLCASTVSKTVRVLTPPTLAFQTLNACEGEDVPIRDNTLSEEDPIVSRQWFLDNQLVGNGAQIFLSSNSAGTKSLRLDVTTAQGCSYSMTQPLVIFEGSDATFALNSNFGIPPFSLQVENNSQNAIGYEWYLNNSLFSTAENPSFSIREEGNFPLKLVTTSEEGCRDSSLVTIISARPMMDLSVSFLSLEQESILLELTNNGNLPITYVDYTISLADEFLVEQRYNQRVNIDETVLLKIDLVFPRSPNFICVNVQSPYDTQDLNPDDNEVCINLNQKAALEAPYPNPARDYSRVHFVIPEVDEIMLTLIDLSGQVRYTKAVADPVAGLNLFELDLRSLEAGTYFFLIEYQGNTYESRIIKQ